VSEPHETGPDSDTGALPPFVLLHGGRHGGWCWRRVARLLRTAGHGVYTPTLTGSGERAHLLSPDIGLDTHIRDLVAVFEYEDITDAVLVGHSYGGMVVSGAMAEIWQRVRHLVYLDGHLPHTGESVLDMLGPIRSARMASVASQDGDGWYIPPTDASHYGVTDREDAAWINQRLTAQPFKTYQDEVGSTERAWNHAATFIQCAPSSLEPHVLDRARERHANAPELFEYRVLEATHDAMVTAAPAVAELLLDVASRPSVAHAEA
jgi:pimeloyl-ACP methyl ester carboxylesterase